MKKFILLLSSLLLIGCGSSKSSNHKPNTPTNTSPEPLKVLTQKSEITTTNTSKDITNITPIKGDFDNGIIASNNGYVENQSSITIIKPYSQDHSIGINVSNESTAMNVGVITMESNNSVGMKASDHSIIINEVGGVINLNGNNSKGMEVTNHSFAINKGTINVNGHDSIGILASGNGSTIDNYGTINLSGSQIESTAHEHYRDTNGNTAIKNLDGATFINNGNIIFKDTK